MKKCNEVIQMWKEECSKPLTAVFNIQIDRDDFNEMVKEIEEIQVEKIGNIGVGKDVLFASWVEELGYNKAVLLSCNYPVSKVVEMSNDDAESEVEAIIG